MTQRVQSEQDSAALAAVLQHGAVSSVFQPVVELDTGQVAGFEALSRGPAGRLAGPQALVAVARQVGRLPELDWLFRRTAVDTARAAGLRAPLSLLVNAEPETLLADRADASQWAQFADLRCYCEITERAVASSPGRLAAAIDQIRAQDWGVALDDVGVDPASLALLPLLQPDLIKLDSSLIQSEPSSPDDVRVARVVDAALAQAADTGAAVIAEGIETEEHLDLARAYGVRYGQGHLLGRAGPLPAPLPQPHMLMPLVPRVLDRAVDPGPFALVAGATPVRPLPPNAVFELARQLLAQAATLVPAPAVLVCNPDPLPQPLQYMLERMVEGSVAIPLMGVLGRQTAPFGASVLAPHDPAVNDLSVAVVTAHFAAAVVARPIPDADGQYNAALTLDRDLALAVATTLLWRL